MPTTISTGKAIKISPENTSAIKTTGKNINVVMILAIPHAAFMAKSKILPNTTTIKMVNKKDNIVHTPYKILMLISYNIFDKNIVKRYAQ